MATPTTDVARKLGIRTKFGGDPTLSCGNPWLRHHNALTSAPRCLQNTRTCRVSPGSIEVPPSAIGVCFRAGNRDRDLDWRSPGPSNGSLSTSRYLRPSARISENWSWSVPRCSRRVMSPVSCALPLSVCAHARGKCWKCAQKCSILMKIPKGSEKCLAAVLMKQEWVWSRCCRATAAPQQRAAI